MNDRAAKRYIRNVTRVSAATLQTLERSEIQSLRYFTELLKRMFVSLDKDETEYIGTYCVMVPDELIYAFGYRPLRLCGGHHTAALIGDELAPRDSCPVVKASIGFHAMQVVPAYQQCKLAVVPMTCDGKRKSAELLSRYVPVIPLPIELDKSEDSFPLDVSALDALIKRMEIETGRKFSNKKLIQACRETDLAQQAAYQLYTFLQDEDPVIKGSEVMAVMNSYCYDLPSRWARHVQLLIDELASYKKKAPPGSRKKPRIYIAGSPVAFPNYKLPNLLEGLGGQIVGDETCMAGRLLYDPVVSDERSTEGMLRALSARYFAACTCPVFEKTENRITVLRERLQESRAEGVIYHVLRGCTPYDFELPFIEKLTDEVDVPLIRVETDFSAEDAEQVRIRLEAFVELIEQRR
jgi:benzoyl-CoA reductase/2-hydroxyglutaryl-CoA dehydratase subunit BcrC/BadD/HgdB